MDGFTGFKAAAAEELPDGVAVMDPFHVVRPAGEAVDRCRRTAPGGPCTPVRTSSPTDNANGSPHCSPPTITSRSKPPGHLQRMIAAYRGRARAATASLIGCLREGVPAALTELRRLGRTLTQRAGRHPRLIRAARHSNGPHRGAHRAPRTPPRLRPRLPQPDQQHRQATARDRRIPTPPTPWIGMSLNTP